MSTNLVSLVTQFLTPDMIAKIASAFGLDKSQIGRAISAAVPGILGSLAGTASTPEGSRKLFNVVSQQPPGILDTLTGAIGGSGQKNLIDNGTDMLSSLLGGSSTSALGDAVGKFAGIGSSSGASLLGLLAPVVMGVLGKQKTAGGLDASGLSQMLTSQKSDIARALPPGFADLLSGTGLLSGISGAGAAQTARAAPQSTTLETNRTVRRTQSPMPGWAWALPAIALIALGWWWFGRSATHVAETGTTTQTAQNLPDQTTTTQALPSAQNLTVGSVNLGSTVQTTVTNMRQALQGVTDVESAKVALPKLAEGAAQLDRVDNLVNQLPAGGKVALASLVTTARPTLDEPFNRVLAIPGVSEVAKPTIDAIKLKLDALTKTAG